MRKCFEIMNSTQDTGTANNQSFRRWSMLALLCVAQFVLVLDVQIVAVALPSIQRALGFSQENLQWIVSSYVLTFGGFLLLAGRAADIFGRRRLFMIGLAIFAGASLVCGLATSEAMLIGARAVQGIGAAIVSPTALSILTTTFREGVERNRALGAWGAAAPLGGVVGLLAGGFLTSAFGWKWIFFVTVPFGVLALLLAPILLAGSQKQATTSRLDLGGAVTITIDLVLLVYGFTQIEHFGPGSPQALIPLTLAVIFIVIFCIIESRVAQPLVPFRIFRIRTVTSGNLITFVFIAAFEPCGFFATLYMQHVLGYSPVITGLAFLPLSLMLIVASIFGSWLTNHVGASRTMIFGLLSLTGGLLLFTRVSVDGSYLTHLLPVFLCIALGTGCISVASNITGTARVSAKEQGLVSGLLNTSTQVGTALGLSLLVTIATTRTNFLVREGTSSLIALVDGFRWAFFVAAGLAVVGLLLAFFFVPKESAKT